QHRLHASMISKCHSERGESEPSREFVPDHVKGCRRLLLPALALAVAACQSTDDSGPVSMTNTWSTAPLARVDDVKPRLRGANGAPLLDNAARAKTTFLEGSGRFIGEP